jgi:hypothetical protein
MRLISLPDRVLIAYTSAFQRPESHSTRPLADTPPMSGLAGPGRRHFLATRRFANEISEIEPSARLLTYK